jgi:hypothetical protein
MGIQNHISGGVGLAEAELPLGRNAFGAVLSKKCCREISSNMRSLFGVMSLKISKKN